MSYHLAYAFVVIAIAAAGFRRTFWLLLVTYPLFLLRLPATETDFPAYEIAYRQVEFDATANNWIRGGSALTSEPAWKWYNALFKQLIGDDFRTFLVFNFWLSASLIYRSLGKLQLTDLQRNLTLALMTPVIFPTIFFWSPRSSISFALCLFGLTLFMEGNRARSAIWLIAGTAIHSQFFGVVLFLVAVLARTGQRPSRLALRSAAVFVALLALIATSGTFVGVLDFLPSFEILSRKLQLFESSRRGFRATGLASIFVVPPLAWSTRHFWKSDIIRNFVLGLSLFGMLINIVFITSPHVAGRLSRLADYLLLPLLGATLLTQRSRSAERLIFIYPVVAAVPFLYPTLY